MKKVFFSAFAAFVLLIAACNSKPEKTTEISTDIDYLKLQVGHNKDGALAVTNLEIIKKEWEKRVSEGQKTISLKDFKIVEGMTIGDSSQTYYILVASSVDGKIKTASLLTLKDDTFYFDTREDIDGSDFYSNIVCEGSCNEGCDPIVTSYNGRRYLNCSQCEDCVKKEVEIR